MNTGLAVVGNMGSVDRLDYTMLGDSVNLAARLEGVNKEFGTYTMVSRATLDAARRSGTDFHARELARVEVVGKTEPVTVYEPLSPEAWNAGGDLWREFDHALALFYDGRFPEARAAFSALSDRDPPSAGYLAKLKAMGDVAPEGWNGVWVMTSK
jgi:adenylate cyclase